MNWVRELVTADELRLNESLGMDLSKNELYSSVEICAGAGGQALGLERAGFSHEYCLEIDKWAAETLRTNRPNWKVLEGDLRSWNPDKGLKVDLLAGGVPCPPFSVAGKQLGQDDERDLFPEVLRLAKALKPRALMIENVKGLLTSKFDSYREQIIKTLNRLGYETEWRVVYASDYGVPQLRPRSVLVAIEKKSFQHFVWPLPTSANSQITVGKALATLMRANGWEGAKDWAKGADGVAPTLVGGSKKHGGADLGPTRAKETWLKKFGIDGKGLADQAPHRDFSGTPRLTIPMVAKLQGFPEDWIFMGGKTAQYRQIGNAFPPPVAESVGTAIREALEKTDLLG